MNIQAAPGSSCSLYHVACYGPHMQRRKLREFWRSYLQAGDLAWNFQRFVYLTAIGQVINYEVADPKWDPVARFGLEITTDRCGPYVTLTYFEGRDLNNYIDAVAWTIWNLAVRLVPPGVEPRARVVGRKGWPRRLRTRGIAVGQDGFLSGWQEYFLNGRI